MKSLWIIFFVLHFILGSTQHQSKSVLLNQVGFYPGAKKTAVVTTIDATEFYVTQVGSDVELFRAKLGEIRTSNYSEKKTRIADFSSFTQPGEYILKLPNGAASFPFRIEECVHQHVLKAAIKSYYYQRFGVELTEEFAGKWKRESSVNPEKILVHASAASPARPEGTVVSSPKGWMDAGDYNKYIVNSGITTATLLFAIEDYAQYLDTLSLSIPESQNKIPDLLDEVVWSLRWMLSMQDPSDGGVYHKCTNAKFDAMIMPHEAVQPRYVVQKSTTAALNLAAVAAVSARVLKKFPESFSGLADSCRKASVAAWEWAKKNPNVEYDQQKLNRDFDPDILTGAYGDKNFSDEFFWAACELAILFDDDRYLENVQREKVTLAIPAWNQVGLLGYYSLVRHQNSILLKQENVQIQDRLIALADEYTAYMDSGTFNTVMGGNASDFVWGSNAVAANQGILMLKAYRITKEKKYLDAALSNLDYILGRNATGYSFVTGFGGKTPMHIHHRPSEADGIIEPVPGLLVGGPNPGMQDRCKYSSSAPNEAYVDDVCSYASNEVAINWNAPLVYLLTGIEFYSRD